VDDLEVKEEEQDDLQLGQGDSDEEPQQGDSLEEKKLHQLAVEKTEQTSVDAKVITAQVQYIPDKFFLWIDH
jgi:hypothetical protein